MDAWYQIAKEFGWPTAYLAALCFALYRVAKWIAPRADKIVDAHTEFVNKTGDSVVSINAELQTRGPKLDEIHAKVVEIHARGCGPKGNS